MKKIVKICFVFVFTLHLGNFTEAQNQVTTEKSAIVTKTSTTEKKTKQVINDRKRPKIKGSGKIATEERKIKETFDKISSQTLINVEIEQADNYEIIVEADDNIIPYILTEISGDKLKIHFDKVTITDFKQAKVYVKLPKISELKASSSATIKTLKAIKSENLKLDASSSGDIVLTEIIANSVNIDTSSSSTVEIEKVDAKNLDIKSSSSSDVKIKHTDTPKVNLFASSSSDISIKNGKTADLNINASSTGEVNAKNLSADNVNVSASSSSSVSVYPNVSLRAKASSTANIYYYNKPQNINKETSSLGTIKQR